MKPSQNVNQTPQAAFKATQIIHLALIAGQLMFAFVAFFSPAKFNNNHNSQSSDVFIWLAPLLAAAGILAGQWLFRQKISASAQQETLKQKLTLYQTAMISRDAMLEGPSLFAIVSFMLTRNLFFLWLSAPIVLYFLYLIPTKEKLGYDLGLSDEEKMELERTV
jgi:protein-S-isoprenylcysteine O-methyltransferase Ste14